MERVCVRGDRMKGVGWGLDGVQREVGESRRRLECSGGGGGGRGGGLGVGPCRALEKGGLQYPQYLQSPNSARPRGIEGVEGIAGFGSVGTTFNTFNRSASPELDD